MNGSTSDISKDLVSYYARRIDEYDRIYEKPDRQADLSILRTMISESFPGLDVFEVACGTGYWTECIAKRASSITATDINSDFLAKARNRTYGTCMVNFHSIDAFELSSMAAEFSAGFGGFFWSHIPHHKRREFIDSFHSCLQDNARVVLVDNLFVESSSTPISRIDNEGNTYQLRDLSDGSVHEVMKNFPSEFEIRNILTKYTHSIEYIPLKYYWFLRYSVKK
jgi:demethylmenaquinone methyltransferase/2-methoxy-6-polyprenyl-1,4-benzoquinol methylase